MKRVSNFVIIFSTIFLFWGVSFAATIDLSKVPIKKTIDLRKDKTPGAWRMIVFLARKGDPDSSDSLGHAYVAALTFREDINEFVTDGVFGLYPTGSVEWALDEVTGEPNLTSSDSHPTGALLVWTNPAQHGAVLDLYEKYKKKGTWQLLRNDCVTLMADAAKQVGLKRPSLTVYPYPYLEGLMIKN